MLKDITLGQYYPSGSVIHKLDPRVKLLGTLLFIISLFAFSGISAYIVASIFLFADPDHRRLQPVSDSG